MPTRAMTKAESERAIRSLCHDWARETGAMKESHAHPQFWDFKRWLERHGYAHYLDFRSVGGADMAAEQWFDEELKQTWRN